MKKYAEMAKQQTLAAAAAREKKRAEAAGAAVAERPQTPSVTVSTSSPEAAATEIGPAPKPPAPPAPAPTTYKPKQPLAAAQTTKAGSARKVLIEEVGSDEDEEDAEEVKVNVIKSALTPGPAPSQASLGASSAAPERGAEGFFAAALDQWSEGRQGPAQQPQPLPPAQPARAEVPPASTATTTKKKQVIAPMPLSNDLIFDLA